jgi:large subunit ribosomal protein L19
MNNLIVEKKSESKNYIQLIENKFIENSFASKSFKEGVNVGDIVRIGYIIPEGDKERTQYYEGLIISKKNKGLGKTFTLRRTVQGIGVEQIFVLNSPKIVSILKKQESKVRRAKLYFIRQLKGKATRLKKIV